MNNNFQIGFFGDGEWSHKILYKLLNDESLNVKFVCPRFINPDQILKKIAFSNKISFLNIKDINSESSVKKLREFNCDLFVSMSYNQILSKKLFTLPKLNTINCHAGKLPFYRGRNPLNWVLINGEKEWGITVHFIDEGIDNVLDTLQKRVGVNVLLIGTVSWLGLKSGRSVSWEIDGWPDHGIPEPFSMKGGAYFDPDPKFYNKTFIKNFKAQDKEMKNKDI